MQPCKKSAHLESSIQGYIKIQKESLFSFFYFFILVTIFFRCTINKTMTSNLRLKHRVFLSQLKT